MRLTTLPIDAGDPEQVAALVAVVEREEHALLGEVDTTAADLLAQLTGSEAIADAALAVAVAGRIAGFAMMERIPAGREVFFDIRMDPEPPVEVRAAARTRLLDHCFAVVPRLAVDDDSTPTAARPADPWLADPGIWQAVSGVYSTDTEGREALAARGLRHVRTFDRMRLDGPGPPLGERPRNVKIRSVTPEDLPTVHAVATAAFADHWGSAGRDADSWLNWHRSRSGHDETLWLLAELDGEPVGVCLSDRSREPMGYGYVATLGVVPAARRRGIADILLRTVSSANVDRGLRGTELTVDSASTTGAGQLYANAGMRSYRSLEIWLRPV